MFLVQGGVTEEQMLKFMGANTSLSVHQAKELIEVPTIVLTNVPQGSIASLTLYDPVGLFFKL